MKFDRQQRFQSRRRHPTLDAARVAQGVFYGSGYLALQSGILAHATNTPFWKVFLGAFAAVVTVFVLALIVAVRWVTKDDGIRPQLQLASLFLITAIAAIYFAIVGWFVRAVEIPLDRFQVTDFLGTLIVGGTLFLLSIPFTLLLGDSLLALAAWIVWLPPAQAWLRRMRKSRR